MQCDIKVKSAHALTRYLYISRDFAIKQPPKKIGATNAQVHSNTHSQSCTSGFRTMSHREQLHDAFPGRAKQINQILGFMGKVNIRSSQIYFTPTTCGSSSLTKLFFFPLFHTLSLFHGNSPGYQHHPHF